MFGGKEKRELGGAGVRVAERVACQHAAVLKLEFSQPFQADSSIALLILVWSCKDLRLHPICLVSDSELVNPPYRAQTDKCQRG